MSLISTPVIPSDNVAINEKPQLMQIIETLTIPNKHLIKTYRALDYMYLHTESQLPRLRFWILMGRLFPGYDFTQGTWQINQVNIWTFQLLRLLPVKS